MKKKIVLYELAVPDSEYCWSHTPPYDICEHFDNEGACPTCNIGLGTLEHITEGVLKPTRCLKLKTKK